MVGDGAGGNGSPPLVVLDEITKRLAHGHRRRRDDTQHLADCRLTLQRPGNLVRAPLQLGEQPGVLDGDDGLIGEALEQCDLPFREWTVVGPSHQEAPDRLAATEQRHGEL